MSNDFRNLRADVGGGVHFVVQAVEMDYLPGLDWHTVDQLKRFLRLDSANDGSNRGRGRHFAEQDIRARQKWTG